MATVQSTSSTSNIFDSINAATKSASTSSTSTANDLQGKFLNLLVTQLKNQDPLNPVDNAQLTSQLAQLSTVSGIEKLNTTLSSLVDSVGNTQSVEASAMIGKTVLVPGSQLSLSNGVAYGGINLSGKADTVKVHVLNSAGQVVQTEELGAHDAGVIDFSWDGKASDGTTLTDGTYKFTVEASQGGNAVTVDTLQIGTVSALVRTSSGFQLDLGSLGRVDFKNVQQII